MRLTFGHNYSMRLAAQKVAQGTMPRHHLWGMDTAVVDMLDIDFGPFSEKMQFEKRLSKIGSHLANLRLSLQTIREARRRRCGAVFFGQYTTFYPVALLRLLRWPGAGRRTALIVTVHFPITTVAHLFLVNRFDLITFLCKDTMRRFLELSPNSATKTRLIGWCVDLHFYDTVRARYRELEPVAGGVVHLISAGKDQRDYVTLIDGLTLVAASPMAGGVAMTIFGAGNKIAADVPALVTVHNKAGTTLALEYDALVEQYIKADVICIPLLDVDRVAGLTSLYDALALGKAVICTRNTGLDIDIEGEGIGFWVQAGDPEGWVRAIRRFHDNPCLIKTMGLAARAYAESHLSLPAYRRNVQSLIISHVKGVSVASHVMP